MPEGKGHEEGAGVRRPRRPWADHWLLGAFQRLGYPAVGRLSGIQADAVWGVLGEIAIAGLGYEPGHAQRRAPKCRQA
jgi:hypothetical protein